MIKDYKIVTGIYQSEFEEKVRQLIARGWQPQGGICIREGIGDGIGYQFMFLQAMIKFEKVMEGHGNQ